MNLTIQQVPHADDPKTTVAEWVYSTSTDEFRAGGYGATLADAAWDAFIWANASETRVPVMVTAQALALHLWHDGYRLDKKTAKLADPAKPLIIPDIAKRCHCTTTIASQAVHMIHVWSLKPKTFSQIDKI